MVSSGIFPKTHVMFYLFLFFFGQYRWNCFLSRYRCMHARAVDNMSRIWAPRLYSTHLVLTNTAGRKNRTCAVLQTNFELIGSGWCTKDIKIPILSLSLQ
ncbi:hypothetical protein C8J55DRAFT_505193 [Lentinula edodes]|uniref:Uncharacterized protein n=1 Tax=Lentinula lateritia TaxID=40482 RepID=A0A9W9DY86_9AGAR|nr:hypothetical protein C8J55DRAFT_505193 [Lentinula edodes]